MIGTMGVHESRGASVRTSETPVRPGKPARSVGVTFYFLGSLAMRLRKDGCVMHLASGTTLRGALESVQCGARKFGVELEGTPMRAFVNGKPGSLDGALADGSEVLLVPAAVLFDRPERVQERCERSGITSLHQHATLS